MMETLNTRKGWRGGPSRDISSNRDRNSAYPNRNNSRNRKDSWETISYKKQSPNRNYKNQNSEKKRIQHLPKNKTRLVNGVIKIHIKDENYLKKQVGRVLFSIQENYPKTEDTVHHFLNYIKMQEDWKKDFLAYECTKQIILSDDKELCSRYFKCQSKLINTKLYDKYCPLHIALWNGKINSTKILLQMNAKMTIQNQESETPMDTIDKVDMDETKKQELRAIIINFSKTPKKISKETFGSFNKIVDSKTLDMVLDGMMVTIENTTLEKKERVIQIIIELLCYFPPKMKLSTNNKSHFIKLYSDLAVDFMSRIDPVFIDYFWNQIKGYFTLNQPDESKIEFSAHDMDNQFTVYNLVEGLKKMDDEEGTEVLPQTKLSASIYISTLYNMGLKGREYVEELLLSLINSSQNWNIITKILEVCGPSIDQSKLREQFIPPIARSYKENKLKGFTKFKVMDILELFLNDWNTRDDLNKKGRKMIKLNSKTIDQMIN